MAAERVFRWVSAGRAAATTAEEGGSCVVRDRSEGLERVQAIAAVVLPRMISFKRKRCFLG